MHVIFSGFGKVFEAVKKGGDASEKFAIKEVSGAGAKLALREAARMARHSHKVNTASLEFGSGKPSPFPWVKNKRRKKRQKANFSRFFYQ
jgi:hypothetical protein